MKLLTFCILLWATLVNGMHMLVLAFTADGNLTNEQAAGVANTIWEHAAKGDWWPVLGPIVVLSVWVFKKYDQDIPRAGPAISRFMDNPLVSFALPFVFSAAGGFGTAMAAGHSPKEAFATMGKVAMEAIVIYIAGKKASEQFAAGQAAAQAVADGGKQAAIDELKKP